MRFSRVWLWFAIVSIIALGADLGYMKWREHSLEPLTVPIDLTKPGRYAFSPSGFHASAYFPAFRLQLHEPPDVEWNFGPAYEKLWGPAPPEVLIRVEDRAGHQILQERSSLTPSDGWIITGSPSQTTIEVYKFALFTAEMFASYRITLHVLVGSAQASSLHPEFAVKTAKSYELLPVTCGFLGLVLLVVLTGAILLIIQFVRSRRLRKSEDAKVPAG
jgi:hypothetical protein